MSAFGHWNFHLLWSKECEDVIRGIDSKDAGSGPDIDTCEKTANLHKGFAGWDQSEKYY